MLHSEMSEEGVDSISRIAVSSASDHLKKEEVKGCEAGGWILIAPCCKKYHCFGLFRQQVPLSDRLKRDWGTSKWDLSQVSVSSSLQVYK